jgi:hypothetical protein
MHVKPFGPDEKADSVHYQLITISSIFEAMLA